MSIIQRCSALHLRLANKLSPYLREKVVIRMMVRVADAVEKEVKSVMFPTRDTAVVTVSSNCCGHFRCKETLGVLWDRKDPKCTSVCKVSWFVPYQGATQHQSFFSGPERKLPRLRRRTFQMLLTHVWTCICDGLP